jgi:hypothetical protein
LLFDDGLKKRTTQSVPLRAADVSLESSTFRGHESYTLLMQGTSQFGIESLVLRAPDGKTFATMAATTRCWRRPRGGEHWRGHGHRQFARLGRERRHARGLERPAAALDRARRPGVSDFVADRRLLRYHAPPAKGRHGGGAELDARHRQSDQYGEMPERRSPTSAGYQPTSGTTAPGYPTQMMGYPNGGGTMPLGDATGQRRLV